MNDWQTGLKKESIEKSVKAGDILPILKLENPGDTVRIRILTLPVEKKPKDRKFWTMDVEKLDGGGKFSMYVANSLRFSLAVEMKKHDLVTIVDTAFVIGKTTADLTSKGFSKDTPVYYAQFIPEGTA